MAHTDVLSIQLYTLRSPGELDRVLDTVQLAGYGHVETIGAHLEDAKAVRAQLDAHGLKVSSSHVSLAALRERLVGVVDLLGSASGREGETRGDPKPFCCLYGSFADQAHLGRHFRRAYGVCPWGRRG